MSKFKQGDTVRCLDGSGSGGLLVQGEQYTVTHAVNGYVCIEGYPTDWLIERFEKVETFNIEYALETVRRLYEKAVNDGSPDAGCYKRVLEEAFEVAPICETKVTLKAMV